MRVPYLTAATAIIVFLVSLTTNSRPVQGQEVEKEAARNESVSKSVSLSRLRKGEVEIDVGQIAFPGVPPADQFDFYIGSQRVDPASISALQFADGSASKVSMTIVSDSLQTFSDTGEVKIEVRIKPELRRSKQLLDIIPLVIEEKLAYSKTQKERKLMLAPYFSLPSGGGGEVALNAVVYQADPLKMRSLFNQIQFNFNFDKSSRRITDPNYLTFGLVFRKIIPFSRKIRDFRRGFKQSYGEISKQELTGFAAADDKELRVERFHKFLALKSEEVVDIRPPFFRAATIDWINPRLETTTGGLRSGSVLNFVNETNLEIRSGDEKLFGYKYLSFAVRLIPLSFESGVNIKDRDNPDRQGTGIFRFNPGAIFLFKLRNPCNDDLILDRVELELMASNRHLINEESLFNPATNKNDGVAIGNKYVLEAHLKYVTGLRIPVPDRILGFEVPNFGRNVAFIFSYKNGYYPPIYAHTNGFNFKVALMTKDETNRDDIRLSAHDLLE